LEQLDWREVAVSTVHQFWSAWWTRFTVTRWRPLGTLVGVAWMLSVALTRGLLQALLTAMFMIACAVIVLADRRARLVDRQAPRRHHDPNRRDREGR
jgi:hypothetical protein